VQIARAGEVVGTAATEFEAHCPRLHEAPPLGTLVRVQPADGLAVYAVVAGSTTDGVDAGARPVPRARDGCEDADIYREHPDLAYVLRTCFQCIVVGFQDDLGMHHFLPPCTAPIHYSVVCCTEDEVEAFTRRLDYFRIMLDAQSVPTEEVLAAHVRLVATTRHRARSASEGAYEFSVRAGREVANLLRGDHQRLVAILSRIRPTPSVAQPLRLV